MSEYPSDWSVRSLGEVAERIRRTSVDQNLDVLTISSTEGWVDQKRKWARDMAGKSIDKYTLLERGEFSYNRGNSKTYPQGCIFRLESWDRALVPNVYHSFRVVNPEIDGGFVQHFFAAGGLNEQLRSVITSSVRDNGLLNITADTFFASELPIPSLPEQKKIAEILSGIDTGILHHRARAKKCEELIAATEERAFEVFRKDDLDHQNRAGRNAKEVMALGDIFDFRNGLNYSKSNTGRGLRVVGVGDFKNYRTPRYESLGEVSPEGLDFDSSLLEEGDFLFVRSNGNRLLIGRCLSIEKIPSGTPVVHSGFTIRARPKNQHAYSNVYIKQLLQSRVFRRSVADLGGGTNISNLSQDILSETMIALPSIQSQEKESSGLLAIQGLYENIQNKLIRLEAMKVAVSSDLLSGRKRVTL